MNTIQTLIDRESAARAEWHRTQSPAAFDAWQDALCDRMDAELAADKRGQDEPRRRFRFPTSLDYCAKCLRKNRGRKYCFQIDGIDGGCCDKCFEAHYQPERLPKPEIPVPSGLFAEVS